MGFRIKNNCVSCDIGCVNCGSEDEVLYLLDEEWLCRDCVLNYFEKVDIEREDY